MFVSDDLGKVPFHTSRWIARSLRNVPLVFSPALHAGGYLYGLDERFQERFSKATHVLRSAGLSKFHNESSIVFKNSKFEIVELNGMVLFEDGFHGDEGGRRWMSQVGQIRILGKCVGSISIEIYGRFNGASGVSAIEVSSQGGSPRRFDLPSGKGLIEFPLLETDNQTISLRSLSSARSPKEIGASSDSRMLTFSFGRPEVGRNEFCAR